MFNIHNDSVIHIITTVIYIMCLLCEGLSPVTGRPFYYPTPESTHNPNGQSFHELIRRLSANMTKIRISHPDLSQSRSQTNGAIGHRSNSHTFVAPVDHESRQGLSHKEYYFRRPMSPSNETPGAFDDDIVRIRVVANDLVDGHVNITATDPEVMVNSSDNHVLNGNTTAINNVPKPVKTADMPSLQDIIYKDYHNNNNKTNNEFNDKTDIIGGNDNQNHNSYRMNNKTIVTSIATKSYESVESIEKNSTNGDENKDDNGVERDRKAADRIISFVDNRDLFKLIVITGLTVVLLPFVILLAISISVFIYHKRYPVRMKFGRKFNTIENPDYKPNRYRPPPTSATTDNPCPPANIQTVCPAINYNINTNELNLQQI